MGKGQRNRANKDIKERRRREREMLPERPVPDPLYRPEPVGTALSPYTRREMSKRVNAWQFLLNYLTFVNDGGFNIPSEEFAPRRSDETAEDAELRIAKAQLTQKVQALAGNWRDLCAEVLTWIPRNDAMPIVANIVTIGADWLEQSGYTLDRDAWVDIARPLLGALCPPHHWLAALDLLDDLANWGLKPIETNATLLHATSQEPVAAIHVAAALVAAVYATPAAVTDREQAHRELAQHANQFAPMV